jgi:uncharacterized small protein (DUF1192 family)
VIDDMLPRPSGRGAVLAELGKEDLDLHSVEELRERIRLLEAEIDRARAKLDGKQARMSAADALFSIKGA